METKPASVDEFQLKCGSMSNDDLISEEIKQRRSIASYAASLSLTTAVTLGTAGAASPLTIPLGGFKVYKMRSHHKKLKTARAELANRNLTPVERKKRDVFIPATVTAVTYFATLGIADAFDIVPDSFQNAVQAPVAELMGSDNAAVSASADKFQAFLIAEAAAPLISKANASFQATSSSQYSYPPPLHPPPGKEGSYPEGSYPEGSLYKSPLYAPQSEGSIPYVASPLELKPLDTPSSYTSSSYSTTTSYDWSQASTSKSTSSSSAHTPLLCASPMTFYPPPTYPPQSSPSHTGPQTIEDYVSHPSRSRSDVPSLLVVPGVIPPPLPPRPHPSSSMPNYGSSTFPLYPPPSYSLLEPSSAHSTQPALTGPSSSPSLLQKSPVLPVDSPTDVPSSPVDLKFVDSPTTAIALTFPLPATPPAFTSEISEGPPSAPATPTSSLSALPALVSSAAGSSTVAPPSVEEVSVTLLNLGGSPSTSVLPPPISVPIMEDQVPVVQTTATTSMDSPQMMVSTLLVEFNPDEPSATLQADLHSAVVRSETPDQLTIVTISPASPGMEHLVTAFCTTVDSLSCAPPVDDRPSESLSASSLPSTSLLLYTDLAASIPLPDSPIHAPADLTSIIDSATMGALVLGEFVVLDVTPVSTAQTPPPSAPKLLSTEPKPLPSIEQQCSTTVFPTEELMVDPSPATAPARTAFLTAETPAFAPPTVPPPSNPPPFSTPQATTLPPRFDPPSAPPVIIPPSVPPSAIPLPVISTAGHSMPAFTSNSSNEVDPVAVYSPAVDMSVTVVSQSYAPPSVAPPTVIPAKLPVFGQPVVVPPPMFAPPSRSASTAESINPTVTPSGDATPPTISSPVTFSPMVAAPPPTGPPTVPPPSTAPVAQPSSVDRSPSRQPSVDHLISGPPLCPPPSLMPEHQGATETSGYVDSPAQVIQMFAPPSFAPPTAPPPTFSTFPNNIQPFTRAYPLASSSGATVSDPTRPRGLVPPSPSVTTSTILPLPSVPPAFTPPPMFDPPTSAPAVVAPTYSYYPPPPPASTMSRELSTTLVYSPLNPSSPPPNHVVGYLGDSGYPNNNSAPVWNSGSYSSGVPPPIGAYQSLNTSSGGYPTYGSYPCAPSNGSYPGAPPPNGDSYPFTPPNYPPAGYPASYPAMGPPVVVAPPPVVTVPEPVVAAVVAHGIAARGRADALELI